MCITFLSLKSASKQHMACSVIYWLWKYSVWVKCPKYLLPQNYICGVYETYKPESPRL